MSRTHNIRSLPLAAVIAITFTTAAHANYTVIDDDIIPVAPATFRAALATNTNSASTPAAPTPGSNTNIPQLVTAPRIDIPTYDGGNYTLPFKKGTSELPDEVIDAIENIFDNIQGKKITIIGRPDNRLHEKLAQNRAIKLKRFLVRQGISANLIAIQYDNTINDAVNGASLVDLLVGAPKPQPPRIRQTSTPLPAIASQQDTLTPQIARLINAVTAGRMTANAALSAIAEITGTAYTAQNDTPSPQTSRPVANDTATIIREPQFQFTAAAETARPKEWLLSDNKTLKDNIATWSAAEGYKLDWTAANFYKVGRNATLTGDLLDTVDKTTTAAGLRMQLLKREKTICITDKDNNTATACTAGIGTKPATFAAKQL